eukprot:tig00000042_g15458.t1
MFGDKKTLVMIIDPTLTSLLSLVAEKSMLQDHGVEPPFYHMEAKEPRTDLQRILYIARPTVQNARVRWSRARRRAHVHTYACCILQR